MGSGPDGLLPLRKKVEELELFSSRWAEKREVEEFGIRLYLLGPLRTFFEVYIGQGGWRRGIQGFVEAALAMYQAFSCAALLWEKGEVQKQRQVFGPS